MNEILFYMGMVLGILLFLLSIYIFFHQNIISVVQYFTKMGNKKIKKSDAAPINKINFTERSQRISNDYTSPLGNGEQTEMMDVVQSYATALLDADDSTTILPDLDNYK